MTSKYFTGEDLEARIRKLEEDMATLKGDSSLANLPYGTLKEAASLLSLRSIGGTGGCYPAGVLNLNLEPTAVSPGQNLLHAVPFYLPGVPNTVTKLGVKITTGAAGNLRLGIYDNKGEDRLYPGKLILDAGSVDTSSTGVKTVTIRQDLPRGLKWAAVLYSGGIAMSGFTSAAATWALLGYSEDPSNRYTAIRVAYSYAALPNPYPAGGTEYCHLMPYVFLKFGT